MKSIFGYTPSYILLRPWKLLEELFRHLKWAWQRVYRGWDDTVVWSIDYYLAQYMPIWLRKLKEDKKGIPIGMSEEEWDIVLYKITTGFEVAYKIIEMDYDEHGQEIAYKKFEEGMDLFKEYFFSLWD